MQSAAGTLGTTIAGIPRRRPPFCPSNSSLLHIISPIQSPKFGLSSATVRASQISSLADSDGNNHKRVPNLQNFTVAKLLLNFAITNFLPIALVSGVVLGIAFPSLGCLAHKFGVSKLCTFGIFLISGLKLKGGETKAVSEAFPAVIFGLTSILLLGPFLAKVILQVQLAPQEFVTGLAIFCCVPTTLSSGVALTQLVGGNTALALAVTVVSNLLGILVVPFWISKLVADGFGVSIPIEQMSQHLIFTLLVPLALGKVLRNSSLDLARLVDHNNRTLSMTSIILLSLAPWMQVSKSRSLLLLVKPQVFLKAVGLGILIHLTLLCFNAAALKILSIACGSRNRAFFQKDNARPLLLLSSQKAFLVAVSVVEQLGGVLGSSGLLILPCIAAHINQVVVDSFLVNFWLQADQPSSNFNKRKG